MSSELGRDMARALRIDWNATRIQTAERGLRKRRQHRAIARASAVGVVAVAIAVIAAWPRGTEPRVYAWQPPKLEVPAARERAGATTVARTSAAMPAPRGDVTASQQRKSDVVAIPRQTVDVATPPLAELTRYASIFASSEFSRRMDATFADLFVAHPNTTSKRSEATSRDSGAASQRSEATSHRSDAAPQRLDVPSHDREAGDHAPASVTGDTWRELAKNGEFDKAYAALAAPDAPPVRDIPEELLLVADIKRLSHHAAEAVAPLRQIVRDHASDPRAPLAAFTLGRVLLDELARPAEAAAAFAQADALAPRGPLAEDALARQVEALAKSGDRTRAQSIANEYIARFPQGRKRRSVQRYGGRE